MRAVETPYKVGMLRDRSEVGAERAEFNPFRRSGAGELAAITELNASGSKEASSQFRTTDLRHILRMD